MTTDELDQQARTFIGYHHKAGGAWRELFEQWADTKDFHWHERERIRRRVERIVRRAA